MFSHVFVCLQGDLPSYNTIGQIDVPPQKADPPEGRPPPRYGQKAGGMQPTGMHPCFFIL